MKRISQYLNNPNFKRLLWPLAALTAIIVFNVIFTKGFFSITVKDGHLFGSLIDILNRGAPVMVVTIGMTLLFATKGIDLSVGSMAAISGALAAVIIQPEFLHYLYEYDVETGTAAGELAPLFSVVFFPLLLCLLLGMFNGVLVAFINIQPIIATLILMVAGRGIAQLITRGQNVSFKHAPFEFIGTGFLFGLPFPVILVVILAILAYIISRRTALGMFIEAIGVNPVASDLIGIKTKLITVLLYGFSAFCAGIAGLILTADIEVATPLVTGKFMELEVIAAVFIGGTIWGGRFTIAGSIIGALILQSLTTMILTRGIPPQVTYLFQALIIISVVLIQKEKFRQMIMNQMNQLIGKVHRDEVISSKQN